MKNQASSDVHYDQLKAIAARLDHENVEGILSYLDQAIESYFFFKELDDQKRLDDKSRARKIARLKAFSAKEYSTKKTLNQTRARLAKFGHAELEELLFISRKDSPKDPFSAVFDVSGVNVGSRILGASFTLDCTDAQLFAVIQRPPVSRKKGRPSKALEAFAIGRAAVELLAAYGFKSTFTLSTSHTTVKAAETLAQSIVGHCLEIVSARLKAAQKTGITVTRRLTAEAISDATGDYDLMLKRCRLVGVSVGSKYFEITPQTFADCIKAKLNPKK